MSIRDIFGSAFTGAEEHRQAGLDCDDREFIARFIEEAETCRKLIAGHFRLLGEKHGFDPDPAIEAATRTAPYFVPFGTFDRLARIIEKMEFRD